MLFLITDWKNGRNGVLGVGVVLKIVGGGSVVVVVEGVVMIVVVVRVVVVGKSVVVAAVVVALIIRLAVVNVWAVVDKRVVVTSASDVIGVDGVVVGTRKLSANNESHTGCVKRLKNVNLSKKKMIYLWYTALHVL